MRALRGNEVQGALPGSRDQHHGPERRGFEKGEDDGTVDALAVLGAIIGALAEE